jgi:hypothetical protein
MLVKLAKAALIASGVVVTFAAGVGTGAAIAAYAAHQIVKFTEKDENGESEADMWKSPNKDEKVGEKTDKPEGWNPDWEKHLKTEEA